MGDRNRLRHMGTMGLNKVSQVVYDGRYRCGKMVLNYREIQSDRMVHGANRFKDAHEGR